MVELAGVQRDHLVFNLNGEQDQLLRRWSLLIYTKEDGAEVQGYESRQQGRVHSDVVINAEHSSKVQSHGYYYASQV